MKAMDFLFSVLYRNFKRTNKSIAEWSTIVAISVLFLFNLVSILAYLDIPFQVIGKVGMILLCSIIILINYLYFLKNDNYKQILKKNTKVAPWIKTLCVLYVAFSILALFLTMGLELTYFYILIGLLIMIELIVLIDVENRKRKQRKG